MDKFTGPSYSDMMPQLFQAIKDLGGSGSIKEIDQATIKLLNLPKKTIDYPHGDSNKTEIEYRLAWTRTYMKKVGILDNSSRGIWVLTAKGRDLKVISPIDIVQQVRKMSALTLPKDPTSKIDFNDDDLENDGIDLPEEIQSWRDKLKNVLYNLSPEAFERLSQLILRKSGFSMVEVVGRTGDGGIDGTGIIKLNGIISFHMLFQCKRYKGSVSASEMRDFRGAMQGRADKGLFITTGKFTASASKEAKRAGTNAIDLVDGEELIDKLQELKLGVNPVTDYSIDEAWFSSI